jgi:hypothetical protein
VADTPRSSSDGIAPQEAKTPLAARIAVLTLWVLSGLLMLNAALTVVVLDSLVDQTTAASGVSRAEAQQAYLIGMIPTVVFGLILGLSAWGLARRHPWARWTGLGAALMLFALTLLGAVAGAFTFFSVLLLILAMVTSGSLLSRTTAAWIPRLRSGT